MVLAKFIKIACLKQCVYCSNNWLKPEQLGYSVIDFMNHMFFIRIFDGKEFFGKEMILAEQRMCKPNYLNHCLNLVFALYRKPSFVSGCQVDKAWFFISLLWDESAAPLTVPFQVLALVILDSFSFFFPPESKKNCWDWQIMLIPVKVCTALLAARWLENGDKEIVLHKFWSSMERISY